MKMHRRHNAAWRLIWGIFMIAIGFLLLLDRLYIIDFGYAIRLFWPVALIVLGVSKLMWRPPMNGIEQGSDNGQ